MLDFKTICNLPARFKASLRNLSPVPEPTSEFLAREILVSEAVRLLKRDQPDKVEDFIRKYGTRKFVTQADFTAFLNPPPKLFDPVDAEPADDLYWATQVVGNGHSPVAIGLSSRR